VPAVPSFVVIPSRQARDRDRPGRVPLKEVYLRRSGIQNRGVDRMSGMSSMLLHLALPGSVRSQRAE